MFCFTQSRKGDAKSQREPVNVNFIIEIDNDDFVGHPFASLRGTNPGNQNSKICSDFRIFLFQNNHMKKQFPKVFIFLLVISSLTGFPANAQATLNADDVKAQMLKDWQRAKDYTVAYLDAMPADKYAFKVNDSIRTFAQQMLHLAQGNINLASNGTGQAKLYANGQLEKSAGAQTHDSVAYYVKASYDFVIDGITKLDASKLGEKVGAASTSLTRLTWLNKAFEHQTHHRGQTTIYIRALGIRPPNERLF